MKRHFSYIILFLGCLMACTGNNSSETTETLKGIAPEYTILKPFSDSVKVDTFKVFLKGTEPKNMVISFSIVAYNGKNIYQKDFKATDLIDNYQSTLDLKKESKQKEFILQEYKLFLDDENFLEPALTENESPDQYTPDKDFFTELKASELNGFQYRLGNENKVCIAWSVKQQKVLPYYSCCKK